MAQRLRIFISSPGDVPDERLRADLVIDKLSQDYGRYFTLESYRWEHEPMLASGHFQDAIEPPSESDIVIMILWSRLGTPLPEKTGTREYRGLDGRAPVTGTEWEFEDALAAARQRGAPDILVFRNIRPAALDLRDLDARNRSLSQLNALDVFWKRYFADRGVFLAASAEYSDIEDFAARLEESLRKLIERRIKTATAGKTTETAPTWLGNPFRGLRAYEFEHAAIFFGRDALVAKAAEHLASRARDGKAFLLLVGGSGSGKSSLIKAALVPRLMRPQRIEGIAFLRRLVFRPGDAQDDIILGLARALTGGSAHEGIGLPELLAPGQRAEDLANYLRANADPTFVFGTALGRVTEAARNSKRILPHESAKLILVVDQFEELFTLAPIRAEDRAAFIRLLRALALSGLVWVIGSMRADFWHHALNVPDLMFLTEGDGRLDVPPPSSAEIAEMIRKPALAAGLAFETNPTSGLGLDTILAEHAASEPGVLPLLSFTLDALYAEDIEARGGHTLTFAQYEAMGGLEGAIAKRADDVLEALPANARAAAPRVLRALATMGGAHEDTPVARSVPLLSFPPGSDGRIVVDAFIASRLLVASSEGETATVRIAHEALIGRWTRARDQLASDRRDLETRALIERQFARWDKADAAARPRLLLRDPDLANALDLQRRWGDELGSEVRRFIGTSHQHSRRRQQLATAAAVIFGLVALAATGFGIMAYQAQQTAERERLRAVDAEATATDRRDEALAQRNAALVSQSRYLASEADSIVKDGSIRNAIALLRAALPGADGTNPRPLVRDAIVSAYKAIYANRERRQMALPPGTTAVAFDRTNRAFLIATPDKLIVRKGFTPDNDATYPNDTGPVARIVVADSGDRIALVGANGDVRVRDIAGRSVRSCRAPEGAGSEIHLLNGGRRLLVTSSNRATWRLFDTEAEGCHEIASRHFDSSAKATAYLVDGPRNLIIALADGKATRLSADDLSDAATTSIEPAAEYAISLAPDGESLYVAVAKDILTGQIVVLDAVTLATRRTFGRVAGGARFLAIAPNSKWLAVHGTIGIDFFEVASGERLYHLVAPRDAVRGEFLGSSGSDYVAFGTNGFIRRYAPELGIEMAAYRDAMGNTIERIEELPDRSGFVTITDRPSVTEWSFDAQIVSRSYTVPLVLHGFDMRMPAQIEAFWITHDNKDVLAAYIDGSARRWTIESGAMQLVREAGTKADSIEHTTLVGKTSVLAEKSGRILIYTDTRGAQAPVVELAGEPLSYLGEIDAVRAFAVTKSGTPRILDVTVPDRPTWQSVAALGSCESMVAIRGHALCLDGSGTIRAYRFDDARLVVEWPSPTGTKPTSAFLSSDGTRLAVSYADGQLIVRSVSDGRTIGTYVLSITLTGDALAAAAQSPLLSDDDRTRIRAGAKEIKVRLGANHVSLSPDNRHAAVAMPDRTVQIIDLASGEIRNARSAQRAIAQDLDFSADGALLAVVEAGDYRALNVYEVPGGERLVSVSLGTQTSPRVRHLNSGDGFATIDQTGRILVHPAFQNAKDLIAYLAKEFPGTLTPAQRRAYFLD